MAVVELGMKICGVDINLEKKNDFFIPFQFTLKIKVYKMKNIKYVIDYKHWEKSFVVPNNKYLKEIQWKKCVHFNMHVS